MDPSDRNDENNIRVNQIKRAKIFPYIKDKMDQLKIDDESHYFITYKDDAVKITRILKKYLFDIGVATSDCTIVDATAGVGGNVLSFSKCFKTVVAYEISEERANFLKNNLEVYDITNVEVIADDCTKRILDSPCDVLFIDPPWGGVNYKKKKKLRLSVGEMAIEEICKQCIGKCRMIGLKLPKNYDIKFLFESFDESVSLYLHELERMNIIVIMPKNN